jgi:DNA-binding transcriptional LysR family regulator
MSTLIIVSQASSFARAAETTGLNASGVGGAAGRLEGRLGVRLFDRNPRATTLTEAGQRLVAEVSSLLAAMEDATRNVTGAGKAVHGRLRLNCDPWFAKLLIPC